MASFLWDVREGRARRALLSPLLVCEGPYCAGARLHRSAYERGWLRRVKLAARVVSVGNLAVGGSGKTPVTAWLARSLRARGRKVAVLSRGVGGRRMRGVNVVSDGERVVSSPLDVGDEPVWIARRAPGVPVLAGQNRVALGLRALSLFGAEVLLLDDGFQHHRLARDVDLVCIDGRLGLGNGHVLPRGPLRERPAVLARADALLVTRGQPGAAPLPGEARLPAGPLRFRLDLVPRALLELATGERLPLGELRGLRCGVLCAIARPDRFAKDLERLGAEVVEVRAFPDHHLYSRRDVEALDRGVPWLTTGKDAVKIPASWTEGCRLLSLEEEVAPFEGGALLEWLEGRLDAPRSRA